MQDTSLILHVKGTEQETTTLPKQVVRAAISQGQITHSQLIWSPPDNAWKQVREMPHLLPSQKLAPAPVPRVATGPIPKVVAGPTGQTGPIPRVAGAPVVAGTPRVAVAAVKVAKPAKDYTVKEADAGSHPLKWIGIGMGALLLGVIGFNYLVVDRPLTSDLGKTTFSSVMAYAHLGGFVQTNVIVIHVPASTKLTKENLPQFLVALAHSTPPRPMSEDVYGRVGLTSGWTANYTLPGYAWKQLGEMGKDDAAQQKEAILDSMGGAAGEPLMLPPGNRSEAALQAEREKVWAAFAAQFTKP